VNAPRPSGWVPDEVDLALWELTQTDTRPVRACPFVAPLGSGRRHCHVKVGQEAEVIDLDPFLCRLDGLAGGAVVRT
jgi:hypothetical protein